ncbi:MAG: heavy-metal-associated domain-containing protein [Proteobacteria bacterium]|nr:heavy-metal-associated domain-containing protein [Pseudomonadota bacterium]
MQIQTLKIIGMNSEQCAETVATALKSIQGVTDVQVSLLRTKADVRFDEGQVNLQKLQEALARAGYGSDVAQEVDAGGCCGGCCS